MKPVDRLLSGFIRSITVGAPARSRRERPEMERPAERPTLQGRRLVLLAVAAMAVPLVTAIALVPFRADHPQTTGIVLVAAVVLVALRGWTAGALLAAAVAGAAYDVLLTEPYGRVVIDDPDDIVATITLVGVGVSIGLASARMRRARASDAVRDSELLHLVGFLRSVTAGQDEDALARSACSHIQQVLHAHSCRWAPGYHGQAGPTMHLDGAITGFLSDLDPDRAVLPAYVELPARSGERELGRFLVDTAQGRPTSREERRTAATIADVFGHEVHRRTVAPD